MNTLEIVKAVLLRSGAAWVLWFLGVLSAASLALIVERWLFLRPRGGTVAVAALARALDRRLRAGDWAAAISDLSASPAAAASIASAGLRLADRGAAAAEKAMESAAALERGRLERGLAFLGTVGNNAPFVGLFGTVVGVIHAFEELGRGAPGHAGATAAGQAVAQAVSQAASQASLQASAQASSQAVMSSIAEALVATAIGILVALPAVAAYNYFQRRVASLMRGTEVLAKLVLAYLMDSSARPDGKGASEGEGAGAGDVHGVG